MKKQNVNMKIIKVLIKYGCKPWSAILMGTNAILNHIENSNVTDPEIIDFLFSLNPFFKLDSALNQEFIKKFTNLQICKKLIKKGAKLS